MRSKRKAAVGAEPIFAGVDGGAASARRDARLPQHRHSSALAQRVFDRPQLGVDVAERRQLRHHERVVPLAEPMEVEDKSAQIAVGELPRLAQEPKPPAHAPACAETGLADLRWLRGGAGVDRPAIVLRRLGIGRSCAGYLIHRQIMLSRRVHGPLQRLAPGCRHPFRGHRG